MVIMCHIKLPYFVNKTKVGKHFIRDYVNLIGSKPTAVAVVVVFNNLLYKVVYFIILGLECIIYSILMVVLPMVIFSLTFDKYNYKYLTDYQIKE